MKKALSFLLAFALCCTMAACGGQGTAGGGTPSAPTTSQPDEALSNSQPQETPANSEPQNPDSEPTPSEPEADSPAPSEPEQGTDEENGTLIVYFTYGENAPLPDGIDASSSASIQYRDDTLTGNTGLVAGAIADATGGELFALLTEEQYPDNYNDTLDVGQSQKGASARPELIAHIDDLGRYDTIFLGYPCWWGDLPMAVYSFLDEYDLSGKTIIPFVTSGGSGFSGTIRTIENAEPDATVLEGLSIRDNRSTQAENDVADWLSRLGLAG